MKRIKQKHRRYWHSCNKVERDNYMRKYSDGERGEKTLEEVVRKAICEERDEWRTPYWIVQADENPYLVPTGQETYKKEYWGPEDSITIRQLLTEDDAKYRRTSFALKFQRIRVPSFKRSDKVWENFYRTFPFVAIGVATGKERFLDGAKLKYIPMFKKILDEEWPEGLKMWTEKEYEDLMRKGIIEPYKPEILKRLID